MDRLYIHFNDSRIRFGGEVSMMAFLLLLPQLSVQPPLKAVTIHLSEAGRLIGVEL